MPVAVLPHFSILPSWGPRGVSERLDWLTAVLASPTGAEQRLGLRRTPRRSLEAQVIAHGAERRLFDLAVGEVGSGEWWLPVWHDVGRLTAPLTAGSGVALLDTVGREIVTGGFIMLYRDAFNTEVVGVTTVIASGITLAFPVVGTWPEGTLVFPAVRARLHEQPKMSKRTDRLVEGTVRFNCSLANDWPATVLPVAYLGYPVLSVPPNHAKDISQEYSRLVAELNGQTGLITRVDTAARSFTAQQYSWFLHGRTEHAANRGLLYALQGRLVPLWLPTFFDDFTLSVMASAGATAVAMDLCGYSRFGGPRVGRQDIRIEMWDGAVLYHRITSAVEVGATESLIITPALAQTITPETVRRISFMALNRLDQDGIEIIHHTDTVGVATVAATFKSTPESRVAASWTPPALLLPTQTAGACGVPMTGSLGFFLQTNGDLAVAPIAPPVIFYSGTFNNAGPGSTRAAIAAIHEGSGGAGAGVEIPDTGLVVLASSMNWKTSIGGMTGKRITAGTTIGLNLYLGFWFGTAQDFRLMVRLTRLAAGVYFPLLSTSIPGSAGASAGQAGWKATPTLYSWTGSGVRVDSIQTDIAQDFDTGDQLVLELGFGGATTATIRSYGVQVSIASSYLTVPYTVIVP